MPPERNPAMQVVWRTLLGLVCALGLGTDGTLAQDRSGFVVDGDWRDWGDGGPGEGDEFFDVAPDSIGAIDIITYAWGVGSFARDGADGGEEQLFAFIFRFLEAPFQGPAQTSLELFFDVSADTTLGEAQPPWVDFLPEYRIEIAGRDGRLTRETHRRLEGGPVGRHRRRGPSRGGGRPLGPVAGRSRVMAGPRWSRDQRGGRREGVLVPEVGGQDKPGRLPRLRAGRDELSRCPLGSPWRTHDDHGPVRGLGADQGRTIEGRAGMRAARALRIGRSPAGHPGGEPRPGVPHRGLVSGTVQQSIGALPGAARPGGRGQLQHHPRRPRSQERPLRQPRLHGSRPRTGPEGPALQLERASRVEGRQPAVLDADLRSGERQVLRPSRGGARRRRVARRRGGRRRRAPPGHPGRGPRHLPALSRAEGGQPGTGDCEQGPLRDPCLPPQDGRQRRLGENRHAADSESLGWHAAALAKRAEGPVQCSRHLPGLRDPVCRPPRRSPGPVPGRLDRGGGPLGGPDQGPRQSRPQALLRGPSTGRSRRTWPPTTVSRRPGRGGSTRTTSPSGRTRTRAWPTSTGSSRPGRASRAWWPSTGRTGISCATSWAPSSPRSSWSTSTRSGST